MRCRVHRSVKSPAQVAYGAARNRRLTSAGFASLALMLAGCTTALTPVAQLAPVAQPSVSEKNVQNTLYTIQDLGVVGANPNAPGQPIVISNSGWISGAAGVGAAEHAVLWYAGNVTDIGSPGLGGNSFGYGTNESGQVAGEAETTSAGLSTTEDFCAFQAEGFSSSPTPCVPFVWSGHMVPLPTLGGVNGIANEINSGGAIAGYAENTTQDPACSAPQKYQFKPVIWSHEGIQPLSTGNDAEGVAYSINDQGDVVGASGSCAPLNPVWGFYFNPTHALLWQKGVATDLGNLGGAFNNFAHHVNNRDEVVGFSDLPGDQTSHAFLWTSAANIQDLGTVNDSINDDTYSVGLGINDASQIVGVSASADFSVIRAFIRQNGKLVDLNSLITGNNSLYLITACSINSKGQIIGIAIDPNTGETHAYVATPISGTSTNRPNAVIPPVLPQSIRVWFRSGKSI